MMAPSDDRKPVPLSYAELETSKTAREDWERGKIHRLLLTETMRRLRAGRAMERSHGVIHPEMTAIVRDALRLTDLVFPGSKPARAEIEETAAALEPTAGARELAAFIARASPAKLAALTGRKAKELTSWAQGASRPDAEAVAVLETRLRIEGGKWLEP